MNDEEFLLKLREAFAIEAEEHLQAMTSGLLELEKGPAEARRTELIEVIYREAHSLKGAARAVSRADIESVCQALESVFSAWKEGAADVTAGKFDTLNAALDMIGEMRVQPVARGPLQEMVLRISQLGTASPAHAQVLRPAVPAPAPAPTPEPERLIVAETVRVPIAKMDALLLQAEQMVGVKLTAWQHSNELRDLGATLGLWRKEWVKVRAATQAPVSERETEGAAKLREFLHWNESQLDSLEKKLAEFAKTAERHERSVSTMIDDLLEDAKRLVMLPFAWVLDSLPKQVRDLSRDQEKDVELVIRGSEVEIDKRILEEMKAPLTHLVRNAIDHGIEAPETRTKEGKRQAGTLAVSVAQLEGNKIEILVSDDGGGIDSGRVRASAVRNGIISQADAAQLSDDGAIALVFQSGVSTSPIITEISGRGLGMAIVREKVEKLGGQVSIETRPRAGTTFRIVLPLTLATFKGIVVAGGGQTFVVPTSSVERITRIKREDIKTVENRDTITDKGHIIALAYLADALQLPRRESKEPSAFLEVLILSAADQRVAFVVEDVIAEHEVLVKELGKPLIRVRNIASATVLGSGAPILILSVADLVKSAAQGASRGGSKQPADHAAAPKARSHNVLVADDSVTSRMLLKNILESAGYHVTTAMDGMDAFAAVRGGEFDLVVSDVEMPRMDGFELTAKIRAEKRTAEVPVVLVTALSSREHKERGIDAGASAYIVKSSFDQSNLLEVIQKLL